jgi:hypothetical protein
MRRLSYYEYKIWRNPVDLEDSIGIVNLYILTFLVA